MKKTITITTVVAICSLSAILICIVANSEKDDKHEHKSHQHDKKETPQDKHKKKKKPDDHGEEKTHVALTNKQIKQAGIAILTVNKKSLHQQLTVPAEVTLNQYRTAQITAKTTAQVKKRFVRLGQWVKKGQKLATLQTITTPEIAANMIAITNISAGLAVAKGELIAAEAEWQRMQMIGRDLISGKLYDEARISRDQAAAKMKAYRTAQRKMKNLLAEGHQHSGSFNIIASRSGMIISDKFVIGQVMQAGETLFKISDIDRLWAKARLKPNQISKIKKGAVATIKIAQKTISGRVINIGRILDEKTRTLAVRIALNNKNIALYPGQFVQVNINSNTTQTGLIVPSQAVLRSPDGDWMVLVETAHNKFEPKEIKVKQNLDNKIIIEGISAGTKIVSKGAFFVQSEIAKSGFEVHNH